MRFLVIFLLYGVVPDASRSDSGFDEEDSVLDQIVSSGDYPDPAGTNGDFDKEKIIKESGLDEMDPALRRELLAIAKKMLGNSEDLRKAVGEAKHGKLDFKARYTINAAMWKELAKNRKIYKPQLKEIGRMLPSSIKERVRNWFSRRWKSVKSFIKHPIKALTQGTSSHNIRKRSATIAIVIVLIIGLVIFFIALASSGSSDAALFAV